MEVEGVKDSMVVDVFYDPGLGDFQRDGAVVQCRSIPSGDATASGVDGDQAPGDVRLSFLISGGLPLPSPVMACSFVASAGGGFTWEGEHWNIRVPIYSRPDAVRTEIPIWIAAVTRGVSALTM